MAASSWGFLLMSAHLGLHWGMLLGIARKAGRAQTEDKPSFPLPATLGASVALYGAFALVKRNLPTYLFLRSEFVFLDFNESKILFYLDYLAIMGMFIFLSHFVSKLLRKQHGRKAT